MPFPHSCTHRTRYQTLGLLPVFQMLTFFTPSSVGFLVFVFSVFRSSLFTRKTLVYDMGCKCYAPVVCLFRSHNFAFAFALIFMQTLLLCNQFIHLFFYGFWISSHRSKGLFHPKVLKDSLLFSLRTFMVSFFTFKYYIH